MTPYIALLRGINVGGNNKIPMKELCSLLEAAGFETVKTYIQTGNLFFHHISLFPKDVAEIISSLIKTEFGFKPSVLVLTVSEYKKALDGNPYPEAEEQPKAVHLYFLEQRALEPNIEKLTELKATSETFHLTDAVFYLHAPDGIGRSKLAAKVEKILGVPTTARNWRSAVNTLALVCATNTA